jgi:hypothetical protein
MVVSCRCSLNVMFFWDFHAFHSRLSNVTTSLESCENTSQTTVSALVMGDWVPLQQRGYGYCSTATRHNIEDEHPDRSRSPNHAWAFYCYELLRLVPFASAALWICTFAGVDGCHVVGAEAALFRYECGGASDLRSITFDPVSRRTRFGMRS